MQHWKSKVVWLTEIQMPLQSHCCLSIRLRLAATKKMISPRFCHKKEWRLCYLDFICLWASRSARGSEWKHLLVIAVSLWFQSTLKIVIIHDLPIPLICFNYKSHRVSVMSLYCSICSAKFICWMRSDCLFVMASCFGASLEWKPECHAGLWSVLGFKAGSRSFFFDSYWL